MPEEPTDERYRPLALLAVVLGSLLLFAVFFLGFLVAPLGVLLLFYVGFSAVDRSRRSRGDRQAPGDDAASDAGQAVAERLAREAGQRRAERDRQTAEAGLAAERLTRGDDG
ncbi:MAG: hypothetical protein JWO02_458 [Solirubrobacterales bacterium]|nr:hypothetical protein [Solirubrobacterales bacterium]